MCCEELTSFSETALCFGSLVLQRRKDFMSSTNRPTFSVLVKLRIGAAVGFLHHQVSNTTPWQRNAEQHKNAARHLLEARSSIKGKHRARTTRSDPANVTLSHTPVVLVVVRLHFLPPAENRSARRIPTQVEVVVLYRVVL